MIKPVDDLYGKWLMSYRDITLPSVLARLTFLFWSGLSLYH